MTVGELNEKIAHSENKDWYLKYKIQLDYYHINFKTELVGVPAIYDFIENQITQFSKAGKLPPELADMVSRFKSVKQEIIELLQYENTSDWKWNNTTDGVTRNSPAVFLFEIPETAFLMKIFRERPNYFDPVYEFLSGRLSSVDDKKTFIGYMLAYEFTAKGHSDLAKRIEIERESVEKQSESFYEYLNKGSLYLTEYLADAKNKVNDTSGKIDFIVQEKEKKFNDWYSGALKSYTDFNSTARTTMKEMEDLYKQKLKLEAPAKYWNDRATKLRSEGKKWLTGLIVSVLVGVAILTAILVLISTGSLEVIFAKTATAIKWSVVFVTLISFIAFAIRIFSKLTFSSYHLVRDAEEREQLTYVYLALQKEKGIDQTERHLIMQSIFSRADSGLLKDDASPTMPGNIVDQVIKK